MPDRKVDRRSKEGKTFRLTVHSHGEGVDKISLTGDFFILPEEGAEIVEHALLDLATQGHRDGAGERLRETVEGQGIQMIGLSTEDLVDALWEALS
jgi:hypothetical protein